MNILCRIGLHHWESHETRDLVSEDVGRRVVTGSKQQKCRRCPLTKAITYYSAIEFVRPLVIDPGQMVKFDFSLPLPPMSCPPSRVELRLEHGKKRHDPPAT